MSTSHQKPYAAFDKTCTKPQSNRSGLLKHKTQHVMPLHNNNVEQNSLEGQN